MKLKLVYLLFLLSFFYFTCTSSEAHVQGKDLNLHMMDVRVYQENLGDFIRNNKMDDALWLLNGMDSLLRLMGKLYPEHRLLEESFSWYYKKELRTPIQQMRRAISRNDSAAAYAGYKLLVKNCNSCHKNLDVEKRVRE
jgi:cytochrome c556